MFASTTLPDSASGRRPAVPIALVTVVFTLSFVNLIFFPVAYRAGEWLFDQAGFGIPTDFINVYSAGLLALQGHPAQAWDWDIQKAVQVGILRQNYPGNFAWHYPPPFLFVAALLAQFPYAVAYVGWALASLVPYLVAMRTIIGRPLGWLVGLAFPVVLTNTLVGQNGFLTAALIGGFLVLLPARPLWAGICLGLLSYKPQYGLLFPLVLIVTAQWTAFVTAAMVAAALAAVSWLAYGTESWQAFFHWIPMWSQAFLTEGRAPWFKMQSIYALTRFMGGGETLGWILQWTMTIAVVVAVAVLWRSRVRYALKAAGLAVATLLVTPYLFLYDLMVLAIAVAFLMRLGLSHGFLRGELHAFALVVMLLMFFPLFAAPTGFAATLIVAVLIARRCGVFDRLLVQGRVAALRA